MAASVGFGIVNVRTRCLPVHHAFVPSIATLSPMRHACSYVIRPAPDQVVSKLLTERQPVGHQGPSCTNVHHSGGLGGISEASWAA